MERQISLCKHPGYTTSCSGEGGKALHWDSSTQSSAGQSWLQVCKPHHLYTSPTHARWFALCRDGKWISIVESQKAALGISHFEVPFISLGTETGVNQLEKQQEGNSAWVNQPQKFNPPSTEKHTPPPNPVFLP